MDSAPSGFSKIVSTSSTLVNASVYYETVLQWRLGLQGKNLTDERYFRSNFPDLFGLVWWCCPRCRAITWSQRRTASEA